MLLKNSFSMYHNIKLLSLKLFQHMLKKQRPEDTWLYLCSFLFLLMGREGRFEGTSPPPNMDQLSCSASGSCRVLVPACHPSSTPTPTDLPSHPLLLHVIHGISILRWWWWWPGTTPVLVVSSCLWRVCGQGFDSHHWQGRRGYKMGVERWWHANTVGRDPKGPSFRDLTWGYVHVPRYEHE